MDKTLVYLERSKSYPIDLSLYRYKELHPSDPFIQIIPLCIGRLKSLSIMGTPGNIQDITTHLSLPAPLLEELMIYGMCGHVQPDHDPMLAPSLLISLH